MNLFKYSTKRNVFGGRILHKLSSAHLFPYTLLNDYTVHALFHFKKQPFALKTFFNCYFYMSTVNTLKTQLNTVKIDYVEMCSQKRYGFIKTDCAQVIIRKSH